MICEARLVEGDTPYREDFAGRCRLDVGHEGPHELEQDGVTVRWNARVTFVGHVLDFTREPWV